LPFAHHELNEREAFLQSLMQRAHQRMRGRGQTADSHLADRRSGRRAHVIRKLIAARKPRPHLRSYSLPELGQHDPSTGALEQPPAALALELADPKTGQPVVILLSTSLSNRACIWVTRAEPDGLAPL
jgi:hypothetical protein